MKKPAPIKRGVSLYSYQEEYCFGKLSLEDCLAVTGRMGIEGVEIIGDQMIHGSPFPPDDFYAQWNGWLDTYNVTPVCSDIFINTNLYKNRNLTNRESIQALIAEIKHAHRLGCRVIRLVSNTPRISWTGAFPTPKNTTWRWPLKFMPALDSTIRSLKNSFRSC